MPEGRHLAGELFANRYELEELVGSGGMSSVYRARDTLLERDVALKILHAQYVSDDEHVERFRREARAVAKLSHPNIVTVIDRGNDDGRQFIVFEYVAGENLKELLGRNGPLPTRRALEIAVSIAHGLAFAHDHGLVHRDVKPQNVLLGDDGETKVTDFGIARSLEVERGMTQTGTVLGTSDYIAPEQASGHPVGERTDVYSLGIVLFELLTGDLPFRGDNFVAVAMKHINEPPPSLLERRPDTPPRLAAAVERALAKDPQDRFRTMRELADELQACLAEPARPGENATAVIAAPVLRERGGGKPRSHRSRWPLGLATFAILAVVAVAIGVLVLGSSNGSPPGPSAAGTGGAGPVQLQAVTSYDPRSDGGDGSEHNTGPHSVTDATDGDPATYWTTDIYATQNFGGLKPGVGLVLDAASADVKSMTVTTDTPGFSARILSGNSTSGPFAPDSPTRTIDSTRATFALEGHSGRYYVVWLTSLPPGRVAHINEVSARS